MISDFLGFWLWFAAIVAAIIVVGGAGIIYGGRAAGRTICHNFGEQTGFKTKMVVTYWADSGTCLAQAPNGQWVLNTRIQQMLGQTP